jgi:tetratricopeptide (TPR) repeat protein
MIADLESAIRCEPANARFHLRLATKLMARYDLALTDAPNEMPVSQLREAAARGGFSSTGELLGWVERAVGTEAKSYLLRALQHIHLAYQQTPLEAEGYLRLTDLAFLEGASLETAVAYLNQAHLVDPSDGDVLIRAGADAFLRRDYDRAEQLWRRAYRTGREYQRRMALLLAGQVPIGFFLEEFQPDLELVSLMEYRYSQMQLPSEMALLQKYGAAKAVAAARSAEQDSREEAGKLWLAALGWYRKIGEHRAAAVCGKRAVALNPQDFKTRHIVGQQLSKVGEYDDAEKHLRWCVDHKPEDARLRGELQKAMAGKMRTASAEAFGETVPATE